ncbi:unnamed protein product [Mytilus coruscus]|uniref:AIG1-type G domain-containing protein n=1 Tax=Mytilus coruscus TaxID=42192 RepID=A0A6J8CHX2_MYTCO|nr:unnamed protein product [Mytilus coruscus]
MTSQPKREIRIILTGKTGSGKSSLGNALLQKHVFKTGCSSSSISKKCVCRTEQIHGYQITVTDTPGLYDTNDDIEMKAEMENCIRLSLPGPHVFLHVISIGRFTKEDFSSIKTFITKFGRDVNRYYLLILTRFDDYKRDNNVDVLDFEGLKNNLTCEWKTLLNETFADRFFPFDNTLSGKSSVEQVSVLLQKIGDIISANNGNSYTNADFKRASQLIKEEQKRMLVELNREREAKKARIRHLEEERAKEELQRKLDEQRAKAETELQALHERENREREQRIDELRTAKAQRMHQRQLQERGDVNFEQAVHGIFQIAEFAFNIYNFFT